MSFDYDVLSEWSHIGFKYVSFGKASMALPVVQIL